MGQYDDTTAVREPRTRLEIEYEEIRMDALIGHYVHGERCGGERIDDWSYFYDATAKTVVLKKFVRKPVAP